MTPTNSITLSRTDTTSATKRDVLDSVILLVYVLEVPDLLSRQPEYLGMTFCTYDMYVR